MAANIAGGVGPPKIKFGGTFSNIYTCQYPQKLIERFEPVKIKHELLDFDENREFVGYRYNAQIIWEILNETSGVGDVQTLIYILNWLRAAENRTIKFYPHDDHDFYVDCYAEKDWQLKKIGEKQKYIGHSLDLNLKSKYLSPFLPYDYAQAASYVNTNNYWTNPGNVIDTLLLTSASKVNAAVGWTEFLYLYFPRALINKIKVKVGANDLVNIDFHTHSTQTWWTYVNNQLAADAIIVLAPGSIVIDGIRIRISNNSIRNNYIYLLEMGII